MITQARNMDRGGATGQEAQLEAIQRQIMEQHRPLVEQYGRIVEAERDPYLRGVFAKVLDNLWKLHTRKSRTFMGEDTLTGNVGVVTTMLFPLLAKVFPNQVGRELVSVQPMNGPHGTVFYIDAKYGQQKGATAAGTNMKDTLDINYSSEYTPNERIATGDGVNYGGAGAPLSVGLDRSPVRPLDAAESYSVVIQELNATTGAVVQTATDDGAGGFTGAVTAGAINYATGDITAFLFTAAPTLGNPIVATYYVNFESNPLIPDIYFDIASTDVKARKRALKARWSPESQDDLMAVHGEDMSLLVASLTAQEVIMEIDRSIVDLLWRAAATYERTFDFTVPPNMTELDTIRSFYTRMGLVSAGIHTRTRRGPAKWAVMTPEIDAMISQVETHGDLRALVSSGLLNQMGAYDAEVRPTSYNDTTGDFGLKRTGLISRKWLGYVDPYAYTHQGNAHYCTMGFRGNTWLDAYAAYCPYIGVEFTDMFLNPEDQSIVRSLRTRDRIILLRGEGYGRIRVTGGLA